MPEKTRMSGHLVESWVVAAESISGRGGRQRRAPPRPRRHDQRKREAEIKVIAGTIPGMAVTSPTWSPDSWRERRAPQQPEWPDPAAATAVVERLKASPPPVFAGEARALREHPAGAVDRRAFLLQAGGRGGAVHQ